MKRFHRCPTKKTPFTTVKMVKKVIARAEKYRGMELHYYYCKKCGNYHTSGNDDATHMSRVNENYDDE